MNVFTDDEKRFIKRVVVSTKRDLEGLDLDPLKKDDLLKIVNTSRSRGYVVARRIDNGKDMNIYESIKSKLGEPIKPRIDRIMEQNRKHAEGIIKRINESFAPRIAQKKQEYEDMIQERDNALMNIENKLVDELNNLKAKELDLINRQEVIKNAREKIEREMKYKKKQEHKKSTDGMEKCWECGEWFKGELGVKIHQSAKHPELKK